MKINNNSGMLLINAVAYLAVFTTMMAVAVPKLMDLTNTARATATKMEMSNIRIAAMMKGNFSNLNQLNSYFDDNSFKKDEFGVNYTYDNLTGELCSTSINYCITIK